MSLILTKDRRMKWQYNTTIKVDSKEIPLHYNIDDRYVKYKCLNVIRVIEVNPLTAFDDIVFDIADWIIERY